MHHHFPCCADPQLHVSKKTLVIFDIIKRIVMGFCKILYCKAYCIRWLCLEVVRLNIDYFVKYAFGVETGYVLFGGNVGVI